MNSQPSQFVVKGVFLQIMAGWGAQMRHALAAVFALLAATVSAYAADNLPPTLEGGVDDGSANFTYQSDAEAASQSWINNSVCNNDTKALVFVWERARLTRGVSNPLSTNRCQDNPHFVAAIHPEADHDAPILYAQPPLSRSAAVYTAVASPYRQVWSSFRTSYKDANGQEQNVLVEIGYAVSAESSLEITVFAQPADLHIGLGSADWLMSERLAASDLTEEASGKGLHLTFGSVTTLLAVKDVEWLPASMRQDSVFLFEGKGLSDKVVLPISLKSRGMREFKAKPAVLYVLDANGRLIGTGSHTQLSPE